MKYLVLLSSLLILGCGSGSSGEEEETVGKEIADDYNEMQDRASAVEDKLEQQKEDIDEAPEDAEGGD